MDELIAKLGVVSGIGNNVPESLLALKLGANRDKQIQHLQTNHSDIFPAVEVKLINDVLAALSGFPLSTSRNAMLAKYENNLYTL